MTGSRERLDDFEEACNVGTKFFECAAAMVTRDGVVHRLPQALNTVDPGMIGGLEQQLDPGMARQPRVDLVTLVYAVVVEDEQ